MVVVGGCEWVTVEGAMGRFWVWRVVQSTGELGWREYARAAVSV